MIKVTPPSFLAVSEDRQTGIKVGLLTVNYQTSLGTKEVDGKQVPQGYYGSWVFDEQQTNIFGVQKVEEDTDPKFVGKDVLTVLTDDYVAHLKALNPNVTIESTL